MMASRDASSIVSIEEKRALLKKLLEENHQTARVGQAFPLSNAQRRLWFLDRMYPGSTAYNVPLVKRFRGPLDRESLEQALSDIVARHEALRMTFREQDGQAVQVVGAPWKVSLDPIGTDAVSDAERRRELVQRCNDLILRPFDLGKGPLFRASLFQATEREHLLLLEMHHIVTDGWSLGILAGELTTLYNAYHNGRDISLPPLPVQYGDFAQWQREHLNETALDQQRGYWRTKLSGLAPLDLATDYPRPAVASFVGNTVSVPLPAGLQSRIQQFANDRHLTPFVVYLAAFKALMHRDTGQTDIGVGTPIANRNRQETEGVIGFFVNTLVLRTSVEENMSFEDLLQRVRQTAFEAYDHQDVPFEAVVEDVAPDRDPSRHPLFQVTLALQNSPIPPLQFEELETTDPEGVECKEVRMDLELHLVANEQGQIICAATFSSDLFNKNTIELLLRRYLVLLEDALERPGSPIGELRLLLPDERNAMLSLARGPETPVDTSRLVPRRIADHATAHPNQIAVVSGTERLTYKELMQWTARYAEHFQDAGCGRGARVGLCLPRSCALIAAQLAAFRLGAVYVALDPTAPPHRLEGMIADAQCCAVVATTAQARALDCPEATVFGIGDLDNGDAITTSHWCEPEPDDPAYVVFTSGSTGRPKGTVVSHAGLLNMTEVIGRSFAIAPADRVGSTFAPAFDGFAIEVWPALAAGATLHLADEDHRIDPAALQQWLVRNAIAVCCAPTPIAEMLATLSWPKQTVLRVLLTGGDRLRRRPGPATPFKLFNGYGPTENTVIATMHEVRPAEEEGGLPSIGRPLDNILVYILDAAMNPVPIGIVGELYLGGAQVAQGYLNRPELTQDRFVPNPFEPGSLYRTGDLGRFSRDGNIEFVGRIDTQVQLNGLRIELGEVEHALCEHDSVRQAAVLLREDIPGTKRLVAYVTGTGDAPEPEALRTFLAQRLPRYMNPAAIVILDELPLTPNGKIDTKALPEPECATDQKDRIAPATPTERKLAVIWADLLETDPPGIEESFFDLGGNSLLILQVVTRIRDEFDVDPPLQGLFENPTIAAWASLIENLQAGRYEQAVQTPVVPLRDHGGNPPLFCVAAVGGTVLTYYALTHFLGEEQPVYGLQDPAYATGDAPMGSVEELADTYAQALIDARPDGPYCLFGWSFGAIVAAEVGRRLKERGHEVAGLFLLDPPPMALAQGAGAQRTGRANNIVVLFFRALHMFLMHGIEGINLMRDGFYVQFVTYWRRIHQSDRGPSSLRQRALALLLRCLYKVFLRKSPIAQFLEQDSRFILIQQPTTASFLRIFRENIRAMTRYRPTPMPLEGTLILSSDERMLKEQEKVEELWRDLCRDGLTVERTTGHHLSTVQLPHVKRLAEIIGQGIGL